MVDFGPVPFEYPHLTVSFWVRTGKVRNNYGAVAWNTPLNHGGIDIGVGLVDEGARPGVVSVAYRDDSYKGGRYPRLEGRQNIADNKWHHVVWTFDGAARLYVDGVLEMSGSSGSARLTSSTAHRPFRSASGDQTFRLRVGQLVTQPRGGYTFDGSVSDLLILPAAWSESDVRRAWMAGPACTGTEGAIAAMP